MGTKNNPGAYDCYAAAAPDEPMFILLARDPLAPVLVEIWATLRESHGCADHPERSHSSKIAEARECAQAMRRYRLSELATQIKQQRGGNEQEAQR